MEDKTKRLKKLVLNLEKLVTESEIDNETYFKLAEYFCKEYADIYVKPIIQDTGEPLVKMNFSRASAKCLGDNADEVACYDPSTKSINVNLGYVTEGEDNLEKFIRLLSVINTVGHEYEHSFQHQYTYYYLLNKQKYASTRQFIEKDKNIINHDIYKKVIGEKADEVVADFLTDPYKESDVNTMLKFFKGLEKDLDSQISEEERKEGNSAASLCLFALYFKRASEEDARKKAAQIFEIFAKDIKALDGVNPLFPVFIDKVIEMADSQEKSQQESDTPIYKKIQSLMSNISTKDFVAFGKLLANENLVGLKNMRFFADPELSYAEFFVKQKILLDAFKFIFLERKDEFESKFWGNLKQLNNIRLAFLKNGLSSAVALAEETPSVQRMPVELKNQFRDSYYSMLKNEPITYFSFDKTDILKPHQKLEILTKLIESGRYEFANSMIQSMGGGLKSYLRAEKEDIDAELKKIRDEGDIIKEWYYLDEVAPIAQFNIIETLEKSVEMLDKQQKEGKLCFDDVDELIYLISTLCSEVNVPYYQEYAVLPKDNTSETKVANKLYGLYQHAEKIGRREACRIAGYELGPDAYRYAHGMDRTRYLLEGKAKDKRIEKVYGKNELARIQRERNIEKEFEDIKENE